MQSGHKPKVLHVGQMIGGLDIYIRNSILYADNSFDYVIATGKDDKHDPIVKDGQAVKEYGIHLYRKLNPWRDLLGLIDVVRIIWHEKPDLIHCHSAKGGVLGRIAGWLTHTKTFYTPHAFSFLSTNSKVKKAIFSSIERITKFNANLLACSDSERNLGIEQAGYTSPRAFVWNNSVPKVDVTKMAHENFPYICYIGRPSYQKNTIFWVDVVNKVHQRLPQLKFYLLGVGYYSPDLNEIQKRIDSYGLEDVIVLKPWLNHTTTMQLVKGSLLYLTVSRYEGLPLAVIEAMSVGKAIVASNVCGNIDCVEDNYNGRLLPMDENCFAQAICDLVNSPETLKCFENNSERLFNAKFNIINRIAELEYIYLANLKDI